MEEDIIPVFETFKELVGWPDQQSIIDAQVAYR